MRNSFRFVALMLAACLALAGVSALADEPTIVDFTGEENEFVFTPETSDLFSNFKGVMPGDSLEQQVIIRNSSDMTVNIYLKALPVEPEYSEFLSYFTLTVSNGETELSYGPANEPGGLGDDEGNGVLLGEFSSGSEIVLDLSLNASLEMGDEFQNAVGTVIWVFTVVEAAIPPTPSPEPTVEPTEPPTVEPTPPPAPGTGDANRFDFGALLVVMGVAAGCAALFISSRKRSSAEK